MHAPGTPREGLRGAPLLKARGYHVPGEQRGDGEMLKRVQAPLCALLLAAGTALPVAPSVAQTRPAMYMGTTGYGCPWSGHIQEFLRGVRDADSPGKDCIRFWPDRPPFTARVRLMVLDAEELPIVYACTNHRIDEAARPTVGRRVVFLCFYTLADWVMGEDGKRIPDAVLRSVAWQATLGDVRRLPEPGPIKGAP